MHRDLTAADTVNTVVAVGGTVAVTVGGAVVVVVTVGGTVAITGTVKKRNFHTGLDPVSRTNKPAKPTELNKVRYAQLSFLDTGLNPVWSVVGDTVATDNTVINTRRRCRRRHGGATRDDTVTAT